MKKILRIYFLFLLFFMVSCYEVKKEEIITPIESIDFFSLKKKKLSDLLGQNYTHYVLLKSDDNQLLLGRIDKAMIHSDRIYLMDERMKSLVVYDNSGNGVTKIGKWGQGPKEFLNLSDFDVDRQGNIYMLDARLNKVLIYNNSFDCLKEVK